MRIDSTLFNNRAIDYGKNSNTKETNKSKTNNIQQNKEDKKNDPMEILLKMKDNLNEQKDKLKQKEMDPKEKIEKLKEIEEQVATVDEQIKQLTIQQNQEKIEKKKEEIEKKQAEDEKNRLNGDEVRDGVIISASLNELINAGNSLDRIQLFNDIKAREKIEAGYLGPMDNPKSFNAKRMAQIKKSEVNADARIAMEIGNSNKAAEDIHEKIIDKLKDIKEEKDEEVKKEDDKKADDEKLEKIL